MNRIAGRRSPVVTFATFTAFATLTPFAAGCAASPRADIGAPQAKVDANDRALAAVAAIHGGAGPWAVAGYRMGAFALQRLELQAGSFDLEVTHFSPRKVQFTCVADGAAAATGASLGKLNLTLEEAADTTTRYRRKSNSASVVLRPTEAFVARYSNVPRERLMEAGREVMSLRDEEIFELVP